MSEQVLRGKLHNVASEILETAAFICAEPVETVPAWQEPILESTLAFSGGRNGSLRLTATRGFGAQLAASYLGLEPDDPEAADRGPDALGEVLNVLAGAVIEAWFGDSVLCELGIPKTQTVNPASHLAARDGASFVVSLMTDEGELIDLAASIGG